MGMIVSVTVAVAAVNRGAESMVLTGGTSRDVPFPHAAHQSALPDCQACHGLFPQSAGVIEDYKKQGKLEKKQVMKQCQACHRKKAKAGEKSGPTRCKACHSG